MFFKRSGYYVFTKLFSFFHQWFFVLFYFNPESCFPVVIWGELTHNAVVCPDTVVVCVVGGDPWLKWCPESCFLVAIWGELSHTVVSCTHTVVKCVYTVVVCVVGGEGLEVYFQAVIWGELTYTVVVCDDTVVVCVVGLRVYFDVFRQSTRSFYDFDCWNMHFKNICLDR